MNEELYFKDCFTEVEEGKINAEFNKATVKCFNSTNQAFSMDCEGNLVVNSITTRTGNNSSLTIDDIYPVGSFYFTSSNTNPSILFGGTWRQIKDKFLLSCGDKYANGSIGGEETHQLTIEEMPSHTHTYRIATDGLVSGGGLGSYIKYSYDYPSTGSAGGDQPHNNMPPYLALYVWERIS